MLCHGFKMDGIVPTLRVMLQIVSASGREICPYRTSNCLSGMFPKQAITRLQSNRVCIMTFIRSSRKLDCDLRRRAKVCIISRYLCGLGQDRALYSLHIPMTAFGTRAKRLGQRQSSWTGANADGAYRHCQRSHARKKLCLISSAIVSCPSQKSPLSVLH
jgi:hypothetical protein